MVGVTPKQRQLLDFVESFVAKNNYNPTYQQIAYHMGLKSLATVSKHIDALVKRGCLKRGSKYGARCLEIVSAGGHTGALQRIHVIVQERMTDPSRYSGPWSHADNDALIQIQRECEAALGPANAEDGAEPSSAGRKA